MNHIMYTKFSNFHFLLCQKISQGSRLIENKICENPTILEIDENKLKYKNYFGK